MAKRVLQLMVVFVMLFASFASAGGASAWSGCDSYITVQWGDTLSGIAQRCGTSVKAIQAANPGLGWWIYAGQGLYIPHGSSDPGSYPAPSGTYMVQWGDTLGKIAARTGVSWRDILAVNPQIYNPSLIYAGQVINLPGGPGVPNYPPPSYPPAPPTNCNCPPSDGLSTLKINYKHGLQVRDQPGGKIIASGLNRTVWYYRSNSVFMDKKGCVWVEVRLYSHPKGYTTGWMLVKDQLGNYFTSPQID
jgi:LysM repeat protein